MLVVAMVSTGAEEMCMEPVLLNQPGFVYTK